VRGIRRLRLGKEQATGFAGHGSVAVALDGIRKELDRYRTTSTFEVERRQPIVGPSGRVDEQG
jgi:hypothetical protein